MENSIKEAENFAFKKYGTTKISLDGRVSSKIIAKLTNEQYYKLMFEYASALANQQLDTNKQQLKQTAVTTSYICTECGGDATIAMTGWKDNTGKNYYKKGERLCMRCHKARTGVGFFL